MQAPCGHCQIIKAFGSKYRVCDGGEIPSVFHKNNIVKSFDSLFDFENITLQTLLSIKQVEKR